MHTQAGHTPSVVCLLKAVVICSGVQAYAVQRTLHVNRQDFEAVRVGVDQRQHRYAQHITQPLQEYPALDASTATLW